MVLPEKYDSKGSPSPVPTCWSAPRSSSSIIGSPAIWLEKRVQRAHSTHRSRSSSTCVEIGTGFSKVRFLPSKRVSASPTLHRLVLQRALAALVADRAVQRVVDEQQLHHTALGLLGDRRGELRLDDHAVGAGDGAGGHRLALALDLDDALPAGAGRVEQRVVAEPRDLDAEQFGGADDQGALGDGDLDAVDRQRDQVLRRDRRLAAPGGSAVVVTVMRSPPVCGVSVGPEGGLGGVEGAALAGDVLLVLLAEVLERGEDRRGGAVAEGAERLAVDVVGDVVRACRGRP